MRQWLTLEDLEKLLQVQSRLAALDDRTPLYVRCETGEGRPWMSTTLRSAQAKGYPVHPMGPGVFHVYPRED